MQCPTIENLKLSPASQKAIKDIKRVEKLSNLLINSLAFGSFANIFVGNQPAAATYSLSSHDFELMSKSMRAVTGIKRQRLSQISFLAYNSVSNYKEKLFWKAIYNGCKVTNND